MQKKIRDAQLQKIPYMLVVGEREAAEGKVAVRLRSGKDLGAMPLETFIKRVKEEAESRKDVPNIPCESWIRAYSPHPQQSRADCASEETRPCP
ncbi:MAG: His/Gly/Thr/Pro-type tRNA ligase C-terminal domain-containing protein [Rhizomicrobium sp.]